MTEQPYQAALAAFRTKLESSDDLIRDTPMLEAELARLEALAQQEIDAKDAELGQLQKFIHSKVSDKAVREALTKAGILPEYLKAARALFLQEYRLEFEDDGEHYTVTVQTPHGRMRLEDAIEAWAETEDAREFLAQPAAPPHFTGQLLDFVRASK
jgi:hypothetical protein